MFSATWPKQVKNLAEDLCQSQPIHIQLGKESNAINSRIQQNIEVVEQFNKNQRLISHLEKLNPDDKILIFLLNNQEL